jgi:hypothetical protein
MVYSKNDQKNMPPKKVNATCATVNDNVETLRYNKNISMGIYIPQITRGCVLVRYSRYWFLNNLACPLL